jgi:regulator of protease activity HflC (stomatin/prohibitin superfamily)|tara:strand:+ start:30 stop:854 length:825 start_codon:yes stop_codon:yes gene_type:complete
MENQGLPRALVMGIAGLIFIVLFGSSMFVTIEPGEKGVLFKKFGGGLDREVVYPQGFHIIAPWNTMFVYDVKFKDTFEKMEVLSKNGLSIKIDLSFRYQPVADQIGYLHDEVGKDYLEKIIKPEIRSVTREVIGNYLPEELYSTKREAIEDEIYDSTKKKIESKYLMLDAILIRDVTLPQTLRAAIEQKLKQEQEALEYEFKIDKAQKEAERKEIEAKGIAEFQKIVTRTITPQLLKWKGIEATQEISKSPNTKVVVIGNSDGELPIILGGDNN